jgi:very-short-patch-repair endonuclease
MVSSLVFSKAMRLPKHVCGICGRLWNRETERMRAGKTCTTRCASIKGYLSGEHKETGIELKLQELLVALDITYTTQKPLLGVTVADIFIEPNVAIFADGEYWHKGAMKEYKDGEKTRKLEKNGYVVLRLAEKEINKDIALVRKKVTDAYEKRKIKKEL